MIQHAGRLRFVEEHAPREIAVGFVLIVGVAHLYRDIAIDERIVTDVHDPHRAATRYAAHLVLADFLRNR